MAIKFYSDRTNHYYDTMEAATSAEFEAKEKENLEKVRREREERERKEKQEKAAAERKAMAEKVEAARKEMVAAQKNYRDAINAFVKTYGTYHFSSSKLEDIPTLFSGFFDSLFD